MLKNVKMFNFEKNLNIYINVKIMQNPVSKIALKSKYTRVNSENFSFLNLSHFRQNTENHNELKFTLNMIFGNFQSGSNYIAYCRKSHENHNKGEF